ncbi:MAG: thiamine-phosphate kinase [Gammaproteobacteria bacterium]
MALKEFEIIKKFFQSYSTKRSDVILGSGDDCALVKIPNDQLCAITTDTLVSGIHFHENMAPEAIAYKSIAVNLSDLAAMGAQPCWITMALTMPSIDENWLARFSSSLSMILNDYGVQLIGGDLTKGPLSVTVQAQGIIPPSKAMQRNKAKPGDQIYLTGEIGLASLGVASLNQQIQLAEDDLKMAVHALQYPIPRVSEGIKLRDIAHAAIDISDGLLADLHHILEASQVGAEIDLKKIPMSPIVKKYYSPHQAYELALTGGDDYELCFTAPSSSALALQSFFCIGKITEALEFKVLDEQGKDFSVTQKGYEHF